MFYIIQRNEIDGPNPLEYIELFFSYLHPLLGLLVEKSNH